MKLDDLKQAWQEEVKVLDSKPEIASAIDALENETRKMDRDIKFRDITETLVAFGLVPFWIYGMFDYNSVLDLAGLVILTLSCLYIPFKLSKARHKQPSKLTSVKAFLRFERDKVKAQMSLLGSVLSWYLMPLFIGIVFVRVGANIDENNNLIVDASLTYYLPIVCVFFVLVWFANIHAVNKKFRPMLEKIEKRLSELE